MRVGLIQALGLMKKLLVLSWAIVIAACSSMTPDQAKHIAYERLSASSDRPSLHGANLLAALTVQEEKDGLYLVELRDDARNYLGCHCRIRRV